MYLEDECKTYPLVQCTACGYSCGWGGEDVSEILRHHKYHRLKEPNYAGDITVMMAVLEEISKQPQQDSLLFYLLKEMGVRDEHLPLEKRAVESLFQMELLTCTLDQIITKIGRAYDTMVLSDHKGYNSGQMEAFREINAMLRPDGSSLFARSGGPKEQYTEYDLPYLLMNHLRNGRTVETIIVRKVLPGEYALAYNSVTPGDVHEFQQILRNQVHIRKVSDPSITPFIGGRYWTFKVSTSAPVKIRAGLGAF